MEIIGPGWLELKQQCWIAWGPAEPWVVKRSDWVLHKQGPKLCPLFYPHHSLWTSSARLSTIAHNDYAITIIRNACHTTNTNFYYACPYQLYLSFMIGYLEDKTYLSWIMKFSGMTRLPCSYLDASQNSVSVLGWVGEWLPQACLHQCMGGF